MRIKTILISIVMIFACPLTVSAEDYIDDTLKIVEEYNIDTGLITDFSFEKVINYIKESVAEKGEQPLKLSVKICGIILICAAFAALRDNNDKNELPNIICILTVFINILSPLQNILESVSENLITVKNFMVVLIPVFAGVSAASGEVMTSTVYSGVFYSGILIAADICINLIIPSANIYFALVVSNSFSRYIRLKSISDFYIKSVRWLMKSIVSVMCFFLTIQTTVARSSDTLAIKVGRAITGTAVPVIGSVLRDAYGSVIAGMEAIKGFAGAVGILGVVTVFLPSVLSLSVYRLCFNVLQMFCDLFGVTDMGKCIKGFSDITELMLSVVILFITMFIFSLTIIIAITNGV